MNVVESLGLKKGDVFQLSEEDFPLDFPKNKSQEAILGMAIDVHIKKLLASKEIEVPDSKYEVYDFKLGENYFDIKSFTGGSVTISQREWNFAVQRMNQFNADVFYLVFKQLEDLEFEYKGYTSAKYLDSRNSIRHSQFDGGGVYFYSSVNFS